MKHKPFVLLSVLGFFLLTISLTFAQPRAYVTNEKSDEVTVIDTDTDKVIATIKVGKRPRGVIVSPDGKFVYVANGNSNDISVIDTKKNEVVETIPAGEDPEGIGRCRAFRSDRYPGPDGGGHDGPYPQR